MPYLAFPIDASWRYSTNNHDGINWQAANFDEAGWSNASPALFYVETNNLPAPKNTPLPERIGGGPMVSYCFRTTFNITNAESGVPAEKTFTDDFASSGARFYRIQVVQ